MRVSITFNTFGGSFAFKGAAPNHQNGSRSRRAAATTWPARTCSPPATSGNGVEISGKRQGMTLDPNSSGPSTSGKSALAMARTVSRHGQQFAINTHRRQQRIGHLRRTRSRRNVGWTGSLAMPATTRSSTRSSASRLASRTHRPTRGRHPHLRQGSNNYIGPRGKSPEAQRFRQRWILWTLTPETGNSVTMERTWTWDREGLPGSEPAGTRVQQGQ